MKYQVYALGSALVDIEYAVNDDFLQTQGIDKGVMTLVTADAQRNTLEAIPSEPVKRSCGGSAANTIIALQQFGSQGYYACKVADDELGHFYADDLKATGVATNLHPEALESGQPTGQCLVMVTPDAERTMHTHLGISEHLSTKEVDAEVIANSAYLYIEGYLVASPCAREAAIKTRQIAAKAGTKIAMTFSDPNMVTFFREGLMQMAGEKLDLLFCNEHEALLWAQADSLATAIEQLKKLANQFVITLGSKGALLYDGETATQIPAKKVVPIDTNGAGDMFAGAFLHALAQGASFTDAGRLATSAAARLITHYGPRLPRQVQQSLLTEWVQSLGTAQAV